MSLYGSHLNKHWKDKILALKEKKVPIYEIAYRLDLSRDIVRKVMKN